jgi:hypothetical protein
VKPLRRRAAMPRELLEMGWTLLPPAIDGLKIVSW